MRDFIRYGLFAALLMMVGLDADAVQPVLTHAQFYFGKGRPQSGLIHVFSETDFTTATGYGFEPGADLENAPTRVLDSHGGVSAEGPFSFSVALPEGNYQCTVSVGGADFASETTVKAEQRKLMLEAIKTAPNQPVTRTMLVHIHTPAIPGGGHVRLKAREVTSETLQWDGKLTLEFCGTRPDVSLLKIEPAPTETPVVYLFGDSTVCDQPAEPWNSWGQMLPRFFKPDVVVANYASSGESYKSAMGAKRFAKILSTIKAGDYLFMQFGHNDMKKGPVEKTGYKQSIAQCVNAARAKGAMPVIVTSMERRKGVTSETLAGFPQAAAAVAQEMKVPLIDLHAMSLVFYRALGKDLGKAFVDATHHNNYGSYELAKCVVRGIRAAKLPLAKSIVDDFKEFDPAHPDPVDEFKMAPSARVSGWVTPEGN